MTVSTSGPASAALRLPLALMVLGAVVGCDATRDGPNGASTLSVSALPPLGAEFGRVAGLEVGEDGAVYVLDALNTNVTAFAPDGTVLWTFGGRGQGPGEFEQPAALFTGPGDNLWIVDTRTGRLTEIDRSGVLRGSYRGAGPPLVEPVAIGFSPDGLIRAVGLDFSVSLEEPGAVLVEYEVSGETMSPVGHMPLPFVDWPQVYTYRGADVTFMMPVPFDGRPLFGVDRSGRAHYAETDASTIQRLSADGATALSFGRELESVPLGADGRAAELDRSEDVEELLRVAGPAAVEEMASLIPDDGPLLEGLFFDDQGNVWALRPQPRSGEASLRPVDIYDGGGDLVGTVDLPLVADPRPAVRNGMVAGVVRDELGVETVVRFRIVR